jgi:hypothetical protein
MDRSRATCRQLSNCSRSLTRDRRAIVIFWFVRVLTFFSTPWIQKCPEVLNFSHFRILEHFGCWRFVHFCSHLRYKKGHFQLISRKDIGRMWLNFAGSFGSFTLRIRRILNFALDFEQKLDLTNRTRLGQVKYFSLSSNLKLKVSIKFGTH